MICRRVRRNCTQRCDLSVYLALNPAGKNLESVPPSYQCTLVLLYVPVVTTHPVGVQEVRGTGLGFRPEWQFLPTPTVLAGVSPAGAGGDDARGSNKK